MAVSRARVIIVADETVLNRPNNTEIYPLRVSNRETWQRHKLRLASCFPSFKLYHFDVNDYITLHNLTMFYIHSDSLPYT